MKFKIKKIILMATALAFYFQSMAQKPILTDTSYLNWTRLRYEQINCTGKFISYIIDNAPINKRTVVVAATDSSYEKRFVSYSVPTFSEDGLFFYARNRDTLMKLRLGTDKVDLIPNCKSYELVNTEKKNFLIYQLNDKDQTLIIEDLKTSKKNILPHVGSYVVNKVRSALITKSSIDTTVQETMKWTDLYTGTSKVIYMGLNSSDQIFDPTGKKTAFVTSYKNEKQIWYFDENTTSAQMIADNHSEGISADHEIAINTIWKFGQDGASLFFAQDLKQTNKPEDEDIKVWNSKDDVLISEYEGAAGYSKQSIMNGANLTVLNINRRKTLQLLNGQQKLISNTAEFYQNVVIVKSAFGSPGELPWNVSARSSYYLCFVKTGELRPIKENCIFGINQISLSPDQKYLLYFDPEQRSYISYNVETQKSENLSKGISETFMYYTPIDRTQLIPEDFPDAIPDIYWITGTHSAIVHGTFDLWQFDLENKVSPLNLTKGKGNKEKVIFSLSELQLGYLKPDETYSITGQDVKTQINSLYKLTLGKNSFRQILSGRNGFDLPYSRFSNIFQKATKANAYLLALGNAATSVNYFYTADFKRVKPLSGEYPEKKYNWFKAELINYKDNQGDFCEGVLYKPENFDPQKRYPVIFYYYLDMTTQFNRYKSPDPSNIGFNIPILVSNGYIVCTPNVYRRRGKPGEAALISVSAAADYLSNFNWIDTTKMGIAGHSLGGFETDYIVTHSNRFKAAMSAAGPSSMIDNYNETFINEGISKQAYVKKNALVMGGGLDEIPEVYIENSPIFQAKKIHTPMLLMHNDEDKNVLVEDSKKLFIQLRSLQKTVWWVQYKGEEHTLLKDKNRIDFQDKVHSFFDVYLKDSIPPSWMTNRIKASGTN